MTVKECADRLAVNPATQLTKAQQKILTDFTATDIRLNRVNADGVLTKTYVSGDVSLNELKRIMNDFLSLSSTPPAVMHIYEGI